MSFGSKNSVISSKSIMKDVHLNPSFSPESSLLGVKDKRACAVLVSRIRRFVIGLAVLNWVPAEVSLSQTPAASMEEKVL